MQRGTAVVHESTRRAEGRVGRLRAIIIRSAAAVIIATISAGVGVSVPAVAAIEPVVEAVPTVHVEDDDSPAPVSVPGDGVADAERKELLGEETTYSSDAAYTVLGGADGLVVLRALASDGYRWDAIASISVPQLDTELWVSNYCLDASRSHMAIVYAPRAFTNDEDLFYGGAWGAIVDLNQGSVIDLGRGHTLAYFNPGCGSGSFAAFTRYSQTGETQVVSVNLQDGSIVNRTEFPTQVTSAVTDQKGRLFGVSSDGIVELRADENPSKVVAQAGFPFGLRVDTHNRLAFLTRDTSARASVYVVPLDQDGSGATRIASGPLDRIGLDVVGDTTYVLGEATLVAKPPNNVRQLLGADTMAHVSSRGRLAVGAAVPEGMTALGSKLTEPFPARVEAWVTETGKNLVFEVYPDAENADATPGPRKATKKSDVSSQHTNLNDHSSTLLGSALGPVEGDDERVCAVPRNDPHNQAYQPKPRQVQWAVDRAVSGQLTEVRPANWRNLGMPAYSPQVMFPPVSLIGGGSIPPQIMLGILAQESNLWQASRYTAPGSTGNPLIGDFYGSRPDLGDSDDALWNIHFPGADCGYGVAQITDGMRLPGKERPDQIPALPHEQQRAIALDYTANVAMAVRMLGQKWNEVSSAGMEINNGDADRIENWFFAIWAYNTGFHENAGTGPWGVGWFNNPINPIYPTNRSSFLDGSPADAANPQEWPYPEKVLGFAAHSLTLPQSQLSDPETRSYPTDYVSAFTTAWWSGAGIIGAQNRTKVKPPIDLFCAMTVNDCDPTTTGFPCMLTGEPECWWHADATWKEDCDFSCGWGQERFDYPDYATEASSMSPSLPPMTLQLSFPPNCEPAPPGVLVVDDVKHESVRTGCNKQASQGSFELQFFSPDAEGHYSGRVDLHQQGGGYNGHFYWSHLRTSPDAVDNINNRLKITGRWSLGQHLNQWTRVWVHLPDHAAWTEQAAYQVELGNGQSQIRYLPQRRYANTWVPLGVFEMDGIPAVSLSNVTTKNHGAYEDDIAWDAVGFQPLAGKPSDFVVALGDSYSSGEGAGAYSPWSDHDGDDDDHRNACHRSTNSWIRKTILPGNSRTIGERETSASSTLDFHFLACSAAETRHLQPNGSGQYGSVSQLDAGYLDVNTTLVTLSIGGNDMRFGDILKSCITVPFQNCSQRILDGDELGIVDASAARLANQLPTRLTSVLDAIKLRAPNAVIALVGYPRLFDVGTSCVAISIANQEWLNQLADDITDVMSVSAANSDGTAQRVIFVDPQPFFSNHTLCSDEQGSMYHGESGINGLVLALTFGDLPWGLWGEGVTIVSQESVHPNDFGTTLYAHALESSLLGVYP